MTVLSTVDSVSYVGNGATTSFSVPFRFLKTTDLVVTLEDALGAPTTLVLNTDYSVTGAGNASGSVILVTAPANGRDLSIERSVQLTQDVSLPANGPFSAATMEGALDKQTMVSQAISRRLAVLEGNESLLALIEAIEDNDGLLELLQAVQAILTTANTWTQLQTLQRGQAITQATTNADGIVVNANGTGDGIRAGGSHGGSFFATAFEGVFAKGANGYAGVVGLPSTPATATVRQTSLSADGGDLTFGTVVNPNANVGMSNRLTAKSVPKAFGTLAAGGLGAQTLSDGLNVASVSLVDNGGASYLLVTFATAMANANYTVALSCDSVSHRAFIGSKSAGSFQIALRAFVTPWSIQAYGQFSSVVFDFAVFGAQ